MTNQQNITLSISNDEALVLYEFLARFNQSDHSDIFEDQAEQKSLWIIEGQLEKQLVGPFQPDYKEGVKIARDRVRAEE